MRRRKFIAGLGSAAAWPVVARAQQTKRLRRIGVLIDRGENDLDGKAELSGFMQGLAELGWTDGRTLRTDVRWAAGDIDRMRPLARALQPDVILSRGTPATAAFQQETRTLPIVFVMVADPVGSGFVAGLPHPGRNITGFSHTEGSMAGKSLELLTEIAPSVNRAAFMFNPVTAPYAGSYYLPSFEAAARSFKLAPIAASVHNDTEIEMVITSLGRQPEGGLVVMPDGFMYARRTPIILLAARNNVPAVYFDTVFARESGLLSYGPDTVDIFRRAAPYVDRILRGEKPAELPVQLPTKFEMALNAKTAKALGLTVPPSILLRADEVIE
jgi:putative ABC transport system substrate-binding protein